MQSAPTKSEDQSTLRVDDYGLKVLQNNKFSSECQHVPGGGREGIGAGAASETRNSCKSS